MVVSWPVTPGQVLTVDVGQAATEETAGAGAAAGGKPGRTSAGAGCGATTVEIDATVVAVARGGGGGSQGAFPDIDDGGTGGTFTVNGGKGSGWGARGGAGGGAGGSYVSPDAQATTMTPANAQPNGTVGISWQG